MKVLFASGDVGGARALLPVVTSCEKNSLPFMILQHGHIVSEAPKRWERVFPDGCLNWLAVEDLFKRNNIGELVFASSVKDSTPLTLAMRAREFGIPVIHVLDGWTGYRKRMEMDGLPAFTPDIYTVIDDFAFEGAIADGIDESVLKVTGQPALASLSEEYSSRQEFDMRKERKRLGIDPNKTMILFVSEPVEQDQGASPESPEFRGYTEKIVLRLFSEALQPYANTVEIGLLPHPREDRDRLFEYWNKCRGLLDGGLLLVGRGRESLFLADGVAGMASILLYEAWLLGKPVISLQPGLRLEPLRMLGKRDSVTFVDSYKNFTTPTTAWVSAIRRESKLAPHPELWMHEKAPENVFKLIKKCVRRTISQNAIKHERHVSCT